MKPEPSSSSLTQPSMMNEYSNPSNIFFTHSLLLPLAVSTFAEQTAAALHARRRARRNNSKWGLINRDGGDFSDSSLSWLPLLP